MVYECLIGFFFFFLLSYKMKIKGETKKNNEKHSKTLVFITIICINWICLKIDNSSDCKLFAKIVGIFLQISIAFGKN